MLVKISPFPFSALTPLLPWWQRVKSLLVLVLLLSSLVGLLLLTNVPFVKKGRDPKWTKLKLHRDVRKERSLTRLLPESSP